MSKYQNPLQKGIEVFPKITQNPPVIRITGIAEDSLQAQQILGLYQAQINQFYLSSAQNYGLSENAQSHISRPLGENVTATYSNQFGQEYVMINVTTKNNVIEEVKEDESTPFVFIGLRLLNAASYTPSAGLYPSLNLFVWEVGTGDILSSANDQNFIDYVPFLQNAKVDPTTGIRYTQGGMIAYSGLTSAKVKLDQFKDIFWDSIASLNFDVVSSLQEYGFELGPTVPKATYIGDYQVKVNFTADDCDAYPPAECELLVVSGTGKNQVHLTTTFTIERGSAYLRLKYPFGATFPLSPYWIYQADTPPPNDSGSNPHTFNWWQDGVQVFTGSRGKSKNLLPASVSLSQNLIPDTGFTPDTAPDQSLRCPIKHEKWVDVFITSSERLYGWINTFFPVLPVPNSPYPYSSSHRIFVYQKGYAADAVSTSIDYYKEISPTSGRYETVYDRTVVQPLVIGDTNSSVAVVYDSGPMFPPSSQNILIGLSTTAGPFVATYDTAGSATFNWITGLPLDGTSVVASSFVYQLSEGSAYDSLGIGSGSYSQINNVTTDAGYSSYMAALSSYNSTTGTGIRAVETRTFYKSHIFNSTYIMYSPFDPNSGAYATSFYNLVFVSPRIKY